MVMKSRARGSHWILKKAPHVTAKCNAGSWIDSWISFLFLLSYERCEIKFEVCEIDTMLHPCQFSDFAHHVVWESWHKRVSYLELSLRWIRKSTCIYVYLCIRWYIYISVLQKWWNKNKICWQLGSWLKGKWGVSPFLQLFHKSEWFQNKKLIP